jgi:2,3-diketo-5-methylthio-1-phosphopentane phosphatase
MNAPISKPAGILVSDFDGTLTRRDFYDLIRERHVPAGTPDYHAQWRTGQMDHFDFLNAYFQSMHAGWEDIGRVLGDMRIDPEWPAALDALEAAGWDVIVASAGCAWYIKSLLGDTLERIELHANPGHFDPATGLVMQRPLDSPYYSQSVGIDKPAIVRAALDSGVDRVVFAGDGLPDLEAALLVAPDDRFARGDLAKELERRDEEFQPFRRWSEIPGRLIGFVPAPSEALRSA